MTIAINTIHYIVMVLFSSLYVSSNTIYYCLTVGIMTYMMQEIHMPFFPHDVDALITHKRQVDEAIMVLDNLLMKAGSTPTRTTPRPGRGVLIQMPRRTPFKSHSPLGPRKAAVS